MQRLASELNLDKNRERWPNWLYRSDHVENTAAILNSGELLSRAAAKSDNLIIKDCASQEHLGELSEDQLHYVRLYFRPRTPTQYSNEGIRPKDAIKYGAHMPVPVYLLFSSSLLEQFGVKFCCGRLVGKTKLWETSDDLAKMNFRQVYHSSSVGPQGTKDRDQILFARHSEAIVKDRLSLDLLKHIVCRSTPERDTLLSLLKPETRAKWAKKMRVDDGSRRMFHRNLGTFVKEAHHTNHGSQFTFQVSEVKYRGPFKLKVTWQGRTQRVSHICEDFNVSKTPLKLPVPNNLVLPNYKVSLRLNGDLAYSGFYSSEDPFQIPF